MFPNTLWVLWAASFCTCLPIICYLSSTCLRDTVGALAALVSVVFLGALGRDFALLPLVSHLYPNRLVSHWNTCLSLVPLVPSCVCLLARCRRLASQCSSICLVLVVRCRCLGPHDSPNSSVEKETLCVPFVPLVLHLPAISVLWLHWDRRISFVLTGLPLHLSTTSLLVCSEIAAKQFPLPPTCLCAVLGTEEFHLPTPCRSLVPHFSQLLSLFPACLSNAVSLFEFFFFCTYHLWPMVFMTGNNRPLIFPLSVWDLV